MRGRNTDPSLLRIEGVESLRHFEPQRVDQILALREIAQDPRRDVNMPSAQLIERLTSFGEGESLGAWETGLKGMRVGGRRVLYVPPAQAYTNVPVIYAIELTAVR